MSQHEDAARQPHPEQVQNRIRDLGWDEKTARETPIRKITKSDGSPNIAEFARAAGRAPSDAQRLVRGGLPIKEAIDRAKA